MKWVESEECTRHIFQHSTDQELQEHDFLSTFPSSHKGRKMRKLVIMKLCVIFRLCTISGSIDFQYSKGIRNFAKFRVINMFLISDTLRHILHTTFPYVHGPSAHDITPATYGYSN
jgi:hypothetical protein